MSERKRQSPPDLTGALHPAAMDEHRRSVRQLLEQDVFRRRDGLSHTDRVALTYERMRVVGKWAAPGSRLVGDQWRYVALMEHAALVDPALFLALGVHFGVCLGALVDLGRSDDIAGIVADLDEMESVASILTTELGHGASQAVARTVARFDPERREFVLHTPDAGAQKFMANVAAPGVPKVGVVYATVVQGERDCGVFPFAVLLRDASGIRPGVHVTALGDAGVTTLDHALVSFENLRVAHGAWLRGEANFDADGEFRDPSAGSRLVESLGGVQNMLMGLTAALAAAARATAAMTARYARQRLTAGGLAPWIPVIRYRTQQEAVFGALAGAYGLTFLVNRTLRDLQEARAQRAIDPGSAENGNEPPNVPSGLGGALGANALELALAKVVTTEGLERVAARCRQRCGAQGVLAANRFLDFQGLAQAAACMAGDNQLVLLDGARNLIRTAESPAQPPEGGTDPGPLDLRDPGSLVALARRREQRLLAEVAEQVGAARRQGATEFDAWNEAAILACTAMRARGERALLESFLAAVEAVADPGVRQLLFPLLSLHALEHLQVHTGWYLTEGLVSAEAVRALPGLEHECYDLLLPSLDVLVDALDVPDEIVGAPIMADDYVTAFPVPAFLSTAHPRLATPSLSEAGRNGDQDG